jgi:hypothetical protein
MSTKPQSSSIKNSDLASMPFIAAADASDEALYATTVSTWLQRREHVMTGFCVNSRGKKEKEKAGIKGGRETKVNGRVL